MLLHSKLVAILLWKRSLRTARVRFAVFVFVCGVATLNTANRPFERSGRERVGHARLDGQLERGGRLSADERKRSVSKTKKSRPTPAALRACGLTAQRKSATRNFGKIRRGELEKAPVVASQAPSAEAEAKCPFLKAKKAAETEAKSSGQVRLQKKHFF